MEWRKIKGFENYSVSDAGLVRNDLTRHVLKPCIRSHGYFMVSLQKNGKGHQKTVHRLVALAFISNPENKSCVNHLDGNKLNNSVKNLEWCTYSENQLHRVHILKKTRYPEEALNATRKAVICIETGEIFKSISEAARTLGLYQQNISKVLTGVMHTSGGYHWGYVN